jgi:hypothetical protein
MSAWLEVRVPISPRDDYFNRIHFIARSVRSLGEEYANVRVRVTVGADQDPDDLDRRMPWANQAGIDWVWVDRNEFVRWKDTQHPYIATMMERFRPPFSTKYVLMLDADVLAMRAFDEVIASLEVRPGIAAVMAHASPFNFAAGPEHAQWWRRMAEATNVVLPDFKNEHSGWGLMDSDPMRRFSPPYFNTGVVLASAEVLERFYEAYMRCLYAVRGVLDSYFFEQIAMTLALYQLEIHPIVLPLRYNFPNQSEFDQARADELADVRFLHFLRNNVIDREADFVSLRNVAKLVSRTDLEGSNEALRLRVAELLPFVQADRGGAPLD